MVTTRIKAGQTDMRYFTRGKLSRTLIRKKMFDLVWQVVYAIITSAVLKCNEHAVVKGTPILHFAC